MKKIKSFISIVLAVTVLVAAFPLSLNTVAIKGSQYTANQYIAGRLDLVLSEYPVGSYFTFDGKPCTDHNSGKCHWDEGCNCRSTFLDNETGNIIDLNSIQCMGFAHYVFYKLFGFVDRSEYSLSKYYTLGEIKKGEMTAENCKNLLLNASTGAHIRVVGHSMVYLSGNNDGLTVLHCNADAKCGVSVKYFSWSDFASNFVNREIIYVNMPKTYPGLSKTSVINTSSSYYYPGDSVVFNWTSKQGVRDYKLKIKSLTDSKKTVEYKSINGVTKTVTDTNLFVAGSMYTAEIYAGGATKPDSSVNFYIAPKPSKVKGQTVKNGIYTLKNVNTGKYITATDTVTVSSFNKNSSQKFYFEYIGSGLYKIHVDSIDSNKLLTVSSDSLGTVASNSKLVTADSDPLKTNRQLFYVSAISNGYQIEPIGNTNYSLNISSSNVVINIAAQSVNKTFKFCDTSGKELDPTKLSAFISGIYQITTESTSLNVRKGAGTGYGKVGSVAKGERVEVTVIDGEWGYISTPVSGWIMLENYTTFISPLIDSISVATMPKKIAYKVGDSLDTTGLTIKVTYSDATSKTVSTGFTCGYNFTVAGSEGDGYKKSVVVNFYGKTTTFNVVVVGNGMPTEVLTDIYTVNNKLGIISGITPGKTFDEFLGGFYNHTYIKVYDGTKEISAGTKVATGMTLKLTDGKTVVKELKVIVTGDVNFDGLSDVSDILTIQSYVLKKTKLSDIALKSADCNGDGLSDVSDILTIQSYILGKSSIKPQKF